VASRLVKRLRSGRYQLRLDSEERELLRGLPTQLRQLLGTSDPSLLRLFPTAYTDDPKREAEYQQLMREDLLERHRGALEVMEETIDAAELDEEQLVAWMKAVNQMRLVLGTRLEVTEDLYDEGMDSNDPRAPAFALYSYLGFLQEHIVQALS
jgi:hypothetical protein